MRGVPFSRRDSPRNSKPSIELHIEELVLHGFGAGDRYRILDGVERELTRLFSEQGLPNGLDRGGDVTSVDAGAFDVTSPARPAQVGAAIAHTVYRGLNR